MENYKKILQKREKEIITEGEFKDKHPEFYRNIGKEVNNGNGIFLYENNDLKLEIESENFSLDKYSNDENLRWDLWKILKSNNSSPEDYFTITNYTLKNKTSELNIKDELKNLYLLIKKNPKEISEVGQFFKHLNLIILNSKPSTPEGIFSLFHEIGHFKDPNLNITDELLHNFRMESALDPENKNTLDKISAVELKEERVAWAYAINKLKPFIDGFGVSSNGIREFIHKFLLGSYSKDASDSHT